MGTLKNLLIAGEKAAHEMIKELGQVPTHFLCETSDGGRLRVIFPSAPTAVERRRNAIEVGDRMRQEGVTAYAVIGEVWMAEHETKEELDVLPSQDPGRIEAVIVEAHDTHTKRYRVFRIDRSGEHPRLVRAKEFDEGNWHPGGTYDDLLVDRRVVH